jgi:hypothetical protein
MSSIIPFARLVSVVGVVLLIMSFLLPAHGEISGFVLPDTYEASCFFVTDDMNLWLESGDNMSLFSFFIVNSTDMNQILETGILEGIDPIFNLENVTDYQGVVHFPHPGIYGGFLSHHYNQSRIIRGGLSASPRMSFIYIGLILVIPMAIIIIERLFRKKFHVREFRMNPN